MVLVCPVLPFASLQCLQLTEFGRDGFMGHMVWTHPSPVVPALAGGHGSSRRHRQQGVCERGPRHLGVTPMERSRQHFPGPWPGVPSPSFRLALKRWIKQRVDVYRPGCCFSVSGVVVI